VLPFYIGGGLYLLASGIFYFYFRNVHEGQSGGTEDDATTGPAAS